MTHAFRIKDLQVPLFGTVEADDQEPFCRAFSDSSAPTREVSIDDDAMNIIAEDLELDAEGLIIDAARYVEGRYRSKARGLQGGSLGHLGEVIAYLLNRGIRGREIVRVVSWRANGRPLKGNAFPQPDFLVRDAGGTGALEVKSTEAFDYQDLLKLNIWRKLQPCAGIDRCRLEALPQLGYVDGQAVAQQHQLVVRNGLVVPFPADFGVATAVLARDGRVDSFRDDHRYKTPKACRENQPPRDCWACMDSDAGPYHVVSATLRNAPHHLPLVPPGDGGAMWLSSYRRWAQSIWARVPRAMHESTALLVRATLGWVEGTRLPKDDQTALLAFWGSYLRDVAAERGIVLSDDAVHLQTLQDVVPHLGWQPVAERHPGVSEASLEQLVQAWRGITEGRELAEFAFTESTAADTSDSFNVRVDPEGWMLTCLPREWQAGRPLDDEAAARIAARLVALALVLGRWLPAGEDGRHVPIPMRRASVHEGDDELHVGWGVKPITIDPRAWRRWPFPGLPWWPWPPDFPEAGPVWLALLAMGDTRIRLVVLPDGRSRLRIPHLPGAIR